jgi:CHAT domain
VIMREKSEDLLDVVRNDSMGERLIYFYCHASSGTDKDEPYLKLGDGKKLSTNSFGDAEGKPISLTAAPLVFINACESAELSPFFYNNFLNYFVSRGARGVIGTECKIPAVFASEWAKRFFPRFLPGKSLGELFLELRREFYFKHNNLLGLAYGLYCDGDTQIHPGLSL